MAFPELNAVIDRIAGQALESGAVGLGVALVVDGSPAEVRCFGSADRSSAAPVRADTVFRVGSITKTFTAVCVLQLVEQGAVRLDDPVSQHLRAYPFRSAPGSGPITIRDVLTHTAGMGDLATWRDLLSDDIPFAAADGAPLPSLREFYRHGLRADSPPGLRYSYANHAFASLGQLVEEVSGRPFATVLNDRVLAPLGMTSSGLDLTPDLRLRLAQGYDVTAGEPVAIPYQQIVIQPSGALHSTLQDMARYVAWLSRGTAADPAGVLRRDGLDAAFQRVFETDPRLPGQGLGFTRHEVSGHRLIGHDGGWPGFLASMLVLPDDGFGVIAWSNAIHIAPVIMANAVVDAFVGVSRHDSPPVTVTRKPPPGACGVYGPAWGPSSNRRWREEFGSRLTVEPRGDDLVLRTSSGAFEGGCVVRLASDTDATFWTGNANRLGRPLAVPVVFDLDDTGRVTGLRTAAPSHLTLHRLPPWRVSPLAIAVADGGVGLLTTLLAVARFATGTVARLRTNRREAQP